MKRLMQCFTIEKGKTMISYIRGELAAVEKEKVIVDVGGVGYGIYMPGQAMGLLPQPGNEVKIHTYLNVREDAMQLFGFLTRDDLEVFKLVIGVSGIGPKGGLSILSQLTPDDLRFAVLSGDVKAISAAPGIGKKTAEKLIIELKDKLNIEDVLTHAADSSAAAVPVNNGGIQSEAVQALVALGYGSTESLRAVKQVELDNPTVEDVLKEALKKML
nr:Holliday junction branch migration protein RuvA [Faecalicatena contorta]